MGTLIEGRARGDCPPILPPATAPVVPAPVYTGVGRVQFAIPGGAIVTI